jgi:hypothetical protein
MSKRYIFRVFKASRVVGTHSGRGSESSSSAFHCSRAVVHGLEWDRAGNSAGIDVHVDVDTTVASSGSRCGMGDREASWGGVGGVGGCNSHRWRSWGWHSSFIKCTMHSDEHIRTTSHRAVCSAVNGLPASFAASLSVSRVVVVVWVLDAALLIISGVVVAGNVGVGGCDVVIARGGSGCEQRGWGLRWGAVGRPGRECCHSKGAGGSFEAGEKLLVAVVDDVVNIYGGCVAVVSGDMEAGEGGVNR